MFFINRFQVKGFLASFLVLVTLAGVLFGVRVAVADSVWVQSYERSSQTQACVGQAGETPWQDSWGTDSSWKPSWEMWANGGKGGWVCTRSITWARSTPSVRSYSLGDIGPGRGLVFLISGGKTYEMAPKSWGVNETTGIEWCSNTSSDITGAAGLAVGTGSANTTAMQSPACTTGAGVAARAYRGGGFTDWFLPSKDELNAMCNYAQNPTTPPTSDCTGPQNAAFATGNYGFATSSYWSSSQDDLNYNCVFNQELDSGFLDSVAKRAALSVRPIRAF
jgi:hypothetical protein